MTNTLPTIDTIRSNILTLDNWLIRGLLAIYAGQTYDEKSTLSTQHDNGIGFNGLDAPILSSFAQFYLRRGYLSPKQIAIARRKMTKYAGQLLKIAKAKATLANNPTAPIAA